MNAVRSGFGGAAVMPWAGCGGPAKPFFLERSQQKHTLCEHYQHHRETGGRVRTLLTQLEQSLHSRQYYLSLMAALTVPDIAGAMEAPDGRATGTRYAGWYDRWVFPSQRGFLTGSECYLFRCSFLHQGSTQNAKSKFARVLFIEPGVSGLTVHNTVLNDALCIDLPTFCSEIIQGATSWLRDAEGTPAYVQNQSRFVTRYESGLPPYIGGVPVIG